MTKVIIFVIAALMVAFGFASPLIGHIETQHQVEVRGLFEDIINSTLNNVISGLSDSIDIDDIPVDLGDDEVISGDLDISHLKVDGVKKLVATDILLNMANMNLDLTLKLSELLISFEYDADMLLLQLVPLYGQGRMTFVFDDVEISVHGVADLDSGLSVSDLTVTIALADATFELTGLINNSEFSSIVSNALNDNVVDFIDKNQELISKIISPIIQSVANGVLGGDNQAFQLEGLDTTQLINEYKAEEISV